MQCVVLEDTEIMNECPNDHPLALSKSPQVQKKERKRLCHPHMENVKVEKRIAMWAELGKVGRKMEKGNNGVQAWKQQEQRQREQ